MRQRATAPIEASASPRNPSDAMCSRSAAAWSLLVAWATNASSRSSRGIPDPSSRTRMRRAPPSSRSISMRRAPASSAFSTSSLTTDAGRSITSPAAIWLRTCSESSAMRARDPPLAAASAHMRGSLPRRMPRVGAPAPAQAQRGKIGGVDRAAAAHPSLENRDVLEHRAPGVRGPHRETRFEIADRARVGLHSGAASGLCDVESALDRERRVQRLSELAAQAAEEHREQRRGIELARAVALLESGAEEDLDPGQRMRRVAATELLRDLEWRGGARPLHELA